MTLKNIQSKYIGYFLIGMILGIIAYLLLRQRKAKEPAFYRDTLLFFPNNNTPCMDCGPGGMFGPGWTPQKFEQRLNDLQRRASELSGGLQGAELEKAIQNAGGLIPYIQGREINIRSIENSTKELGGVMTIPGVHGIGPMIDHIHIAVLDESAKNKVKQFIAEKNKKFIPGAQDGTYGGIPVMIAIEPQAKAQ